VDIDINPSLELSIDKNDTIIKTRPLNTDGKTLAEELKLEGLDLKDGMLRIFEKSMEDGFIYSGKENVVLISACVNPNLEYNGAADKNVDSFLESVGQMDLKTYNITTRVMKITPEDRKTAIKNDLSMGRYELYKKAREDKVNLTLVQVRNGSVSDLLSKVYTSGNEAVAPVQTDSVHTHIETVTATTAITQTPSVSKKSTQTMTPTTLTKMTPIVASTPKPTQKELVRFDGTGLRGEYYDNLDLTDLKTVRIDSIMDFNWSVFPPSGIKNDGSFSIRWQGEIQPVYSEEYAFHVTRDNGVRLWINNKLLIDQWNDKCSVTDSAKVILEAGKKYDIKLEYYNNTGLSYVKFEWSSASTKKAVIPKTCLYPSSEPIPETPALPGNGTGLKGQYYDNIDLTSLKLTSVDPVINFNWGVGSPDSAVKEDGQFSIRWTGKVEPLYSEEYTFYITYDDGVKFWINNKLLVDKWTSGASGEKQVKINLEADKKYDIKIEYRNTYQWGRVKLEWSSASTKKMVIPKSRLYPK
jgi:hypothetical protein